MLDTSILFNLCSLNFLLLLLDLIFHDFILHHMITLLSELVFVLLGNEFALLGFFFFMETNCIFDLFGLHIPLLLHHLHVLSVLIKSLLFIHFEIHFLLRPLFIFGF